MEFKKGKKVRVVAENSGHQYDIGSVITMQDDFGDSFMGKEKFCGDTWQVYYSDCEEIELTLEEVREHFKDAKEVSGIDGGGLYSIDVLKYGIHNEGGGVFRQNVNEKGWCILLVNGRAFAEIVSYKSEETTALEAYNKHHQTFYTQDKPAQYQIGIDTFKRMEANCTTDECIAFAKGNIDKYLWRVKGQDESDFEKIIDYANWALKLIKQTKNK